VLQTHERFLRTDSPLEKQSRQDDLQHDPTANRPAAGQGKYEPLYSEGSPHENGEDHAGETDWTTVAGTLVIAPRSTEEVHHVS